MEMNVKKEIEDLNLEPIKEKPYEKPEVFMQPLNYDSYPENLTPYDKNVFCAICTILKSGQNDVSARQIHEVMTGSNVRSKHAANAVEESIKKMRNTGSLIELNNFILNGSLISAKEVEREYFTKKGEKAKYRVYHFNELSHCFRYLEQMDQICKVEKKVLQVPKLNNTKEVIALKNYLIMYIENVKKNRLRNVALTYKTLFNDCNIKTSHQNLPRKRAAITDILDYWQKIGYIKNYEIIKKGRIYHAIKIYPKTMNSVNFL